MQMPAPAQAPPSHYLQDSAVFHWDKQTLPADLILTVAVALCLGVGIAVGHPAAGMIAAGGAVNTGFGHKHSIDDSWLLPMILVTLGMAFSGFLGVLIGHENLLLVLVSGLLGFGYGLLTARPEGYAWVGQQCVITFLVASAFPASPTQAAQRGLLLLAGARCEREPEVRQPLVPRAGPAELLGRGRDVPAGDGVLRLGRRSRAE